MHCADHLHDFPFHCGTNNHSLVNAETIFRLFLDVVGVKKSPKGSGSLGDMQVRRRRHREGLLLAEGRLTAQ